MLISNVIISLGLMMAKTTLFLLYLEIFRPLTWLRVTIFIGATTNVLFYLCVIIANTVLASPKAGETWFIHVMSKEMSKTRDLAIWSSAIGLAYDILLLV